jgi:methyl-accepting chemotaxis protein
MSTIVATSTAAGSAEAAAASLKKQLGAVLGGKKPALVMVFASTDQPLEKLAPAMARAFPEAAVLAASTAGEFTERGDVKKSVSAVAIAGDFAVRAGIGRGLRADPEAAVRMAIEGIPRALPGYTHRTGIILLDPLSGNGEEATLIAASLLGDDIRLAGGAAGDDLGMARTFVSCGDRVASDAIVVAIVFSNAPLGVGVCHGHLPISEPLTITKAEGGTLQEIEGRPAWDVWAEKTREAASKIGLDPLTLRADQIGPFLLRYEAGLASGGEYKIRAPLSKNADGSLALACAIPEGAKIRITESVPERQIESAREAARRARAQMKGKAAGAIVFDCICRNLILGDGFSAAVKGISEELGNVPLAGFETYGEIALDAGDLSGFHNTTTVVLAFPE